MKRKTKKIIKNTLLGVLCLGIVGGAAAGGKALYDYSKEDLKTINPVFHVGGLDANGEYVDTDQSLYSDMFKCRGLDIELDFENDIKVDIYYYNYDKKFLRNCEYDKDNDVVSSVFYNYARIVIQPQWTNVEIPDEKNEEDIKVVKWSNITTFTSQIEIKVSKEQDFDTNHLEKYVSVEKNSVPNPDAGGSPMNKIGYSYCNLDMYVGLEYAFSNPTSVCDLDKFDKIVFIFDDKVVDAGDCMINIDYNYADSIKENVIDNKMEFSIKNISNFSFTTLNGKLPQIKLVEE